MNYASGLSPLNQSIQLQNSDESNVNEFGWNLDGYPYSSALDFEGITFSGIDNVAYTYNKITGRTQVYHQGGFSLNGGTYMY